MAISGVHSSGDECLVHQRKNNSLNPCARPTFFGQRLVNGIIVNWESGKSHMTISGLHGTWLRTHAVVVLLRVSSLRNSALREILSHLRNFLRLLTDSGVDDLGHVSAGGYLRCAIACNRPLFSMTYKLNMFGTCVACSSCVA